MDKSRLRIAFNLGLSLLSILLYWRIFSWADVTPQEKATALLSIIGAYGIGIGFVGRIKDLGEEVQKLVAELVDPDAVTYLAANFYYLGMVSGLLSVGLDSRKTETPAPLQFFLGTIALLLMAVGVFAYMLFHLFVVIPVSYPAVLVASSVVRAFESAAADTQFVFRSDGEKRDHALEAAEPAGAAEDANATRVSLKVFVTRDKVAATGFIMGLPAAVLALVSNALLPFIS